MCPTRSLAGMLSEHGHTVFLYAFGFNPGSPPNHALEGLAGHATELAFAFGVQFPGVGFPWNPTLADESSDLWSAFIRCLMLNRPLNMYLNIFSSFLIRTGNPNTIGTLWEPYNAKNQPYVLVDSPSPISQRGYRTQSCDFFDQFIQNPNNYRQTLAFCIQLQI